MLYFPPSQELIDEKQNQRERTRQSFQSPSLQVEKQTNRQNKKSTSLFYLIYSFSGTLN